MVLAVLLPVSVTHSPAIKLSVSVVVAAVGLVPKIEPVEPVVVLIAKVLNKAGVGTQ